MLGISILEFGTATEWLRSGLQVRIDSVFGSKVNREGRVTEVHL